MKISGAGCCLYDYLYKNISFSSPGFSRFRSRTPGDGGITPGELVFAEDLSRYSDRPVESCLKELTGGNRPDAVNLGGPALVAMIHASQMLPPRWDIRFYASLGGDRSSRELAEDLSRFPLTLKATEAPEHRVPSTVVLSDPSWHGGAGERTFINTLGSALAFSPDLLEGDFFESDICLWGGTALVPPLHDRLGELTAEAKSRGAFNIVGTVYDFRNQRQDPDGRWPLGRRDKSAYPGIDLLITDREEAFRLSGKSSTEEAAEYFLDQGCGACLITRGRDDVYARTGSRGFSPLKGTSYRVSEYVDRDLKAHPEKRGDTTGCGDNFMGGVLVSLARQMEGGKEQVLDLEEAVVEGVSAGGFALYSMGGVFRESFPGEKKREIDEIKKHYREQMA